MSEQDWKIESGEAAGMGAAIAVTLYGVALVGASLFLDKLLVPEEMALVLVLLLAVATVGAVLGAGLTRLRS